MVAYVEELEKGNLIKRTYLPTRPCDEREEIYTRSEYDLQPWEAHMDSEFAKRAFYPILDDDTEYALDLRNRGVLQCIDAEKIEVTGASRKKALQLNIEYRPCQPDPATGKKCKKQTLAQLQDHLTHPELLVWHNTPFSINGQARFPSCLCIASTSGSLIGPKLW